MQTTTNYNMSKPEYSDAADIAPISGNMDTIDTALHKARTRDADLYDETTTYNVGDYCIYADTLYRCTGATTGTWDLTKWQATTIADAFEPKQTWELFETITADGNERFVYSSDLPEGITGIFINNIVQAGASAQTLAFNFSFDGSTYPIYISVGSGINTGIRYSQVWFEKDGNMWKTKATEVGTSATSTTRIVENLAGFHIGDEVKKARAYAPANEVVPSGSTFEIYIRR